MIGWARPFRTCFLVNFDAATLKGSERSFAEHLVPSLDPCERPLVWT